MPMIPFSRFFLPCLCAATCSVFFTTPGSAMKDPMYVRLDEIFVAADKAVDALASRHRPGLIDRIGRMKDGTYRISAGRCSVAVALTYPPTESDCEGCWVKPKASLVGEVQCDEPEKLRLAVVGGDPGMLDGRVRAASPFEIVASSANPDLLWDSHTHNVTDSRRRSMAVATSEIEGSPGADGMRLGKPRVCAFRHAMNSGSDRARECLVHPVWRRTATVRDLS
jgi:hypothetical protein